MGGLLHLVQRGVDWAEPQTTQAPPRCTNTTYHSQTVTVDSVFAQSAVTFFSFCAMSSSNFSPSGFRCCWSDGVHGTLYLTIYEICHVAIVILDVS